MKALTIADVLAVPAAGGYFADDQAAIKAGAVRDGLAYPGDVRVPAEAVSVLLRLSDGYVAHGDCVSVQYAGVGGREPRLQAESLAARIRDEVPLRGREVTAFRDMLLEGYGAAADYGISQALLDAAAHRAGTTMAEVIKAEWGLDHAFRRVPVYAQTGEARHDNVDKMVLKQVDSLPHGLINTPELAAGIVDYVRWVRDRVLQAAALAGLRADPALRRLRAARHRPTGHPRNGRGGGAVRAARRASVRRWLARRADRRAWPHCAPSWAAACSWSPTSGRTRSTTSAPSTRAGAADVVQIKTPDLGALHHTVDAILDCKAHDVVAHVGGSCAETERSAQVSAHVAIGADADQMLAKPGMGVDEGLSIVRNEMARMLELALPRVYKPW